MQTPILLSAPIFDGKEGEFIQRAINSGMIATNGIYIGQFEKEIAKKFKTHQMVGLNSGTSALHLALLILNIKPGDEVICQSFTFCASANPILYLGGIPIFVDSEPETWNICPDILEDTILNRMANGKKPKAVISVDLFGMPAQYDKILQVCKKYEIPLIEDAAEAVGSKYKDQYCGTFGDIGIFSFNGNKIITGGGGGGLIASDTKKLYKARYYANQARENIHYYEHKEVGYNYRMTNLTAAMVMAQLAKLDAKIEQRRQIFNNYKILFKDFKGISFLQERADTFSNRWLTTILVDPKLSGFTNEDLRISLQKENIESRYLWKPLHMQPVYKNLPYYGGHLAEDLFNMGLCLPSSSQLTFREQMKVTAVIEKQFQNVI